MSPNRMTMNDNAFLEVSVFIFTAGLYVKILYKEPQAAI